MIGVKEASNPSIITIDAILSAVKMRIPVFRHSRYSEKVGVVMSKSDYVQIPHLDIVSSNNHSWIIYVPLCEHGAWIYVWDNGDASNTTREMIHIPFG